MKIGWLCLLIVTLTAVQAAGVSWGAGSQPSVWIVAPENGSTATAGEVLDVYVAAATGENVSTIAVTCDGRGIGMASAAPATIRWDTGGLAPGPHALRANAVLDSGAVVSSDSVVVTLTGAAEVAVAGPGPSREPDQRLQPARRTTLGMGLGIPYGVVGLNVESGRQTCFSGGLGWGIEEVAWNVGVKHYFRPLSEGRGSSSISLYYGTNTYLQRWGGSDELLEGFSVGLGWTSGHFDIGAIVPFAANVPSGAEEQGPGVKLYIGYRFGSAEKAVTTPAPRVESRQPEPLPLPSPDRTDEADTWDDVLDRMKRQ